jgi:hypothetical protein
MSGPLSGNSVESLMGASGEVLMTGYYPGSAFLGAVVVAICFGSRSERGESTRATRLSVRPGRSAES